VSKMNRKGIVLLIVIGLLALSGMALAQSHEGEESDDTIFNFGYDEGFHLLVWNTSPIDGPNDCTLQNGDVKARYGLNEDGLIVVDGLTQGDPPEEVSFPGREDGDGDGDVFYSESEECSLGTVDVTGPNGQVNHGMFMKAWNSAWDGVGRGCLNRHLAGSDLGKEDGQQIKANVDSDFVPVEEGETGVIDFLTFTADCEHGNGNGNGHGNGAEAAANSGGRPDSPGKSGDARGRNK